MNYLKIIAIFCAPIYGTLFTKDNINWKDLILKYLRHLVLSNVITNFILYTFTESLELTFTSLFFVKYTSLNIAITICISLVELIIKKNIEVDLNVKSKKN